MSHERAPPNYYRARLTAVGLVVGGHIIALAALLSARDDREWEAPDERMTLVYVAPIEVPRPPPARAHPTRDMRPHQPAPFVPAPPARSNESAAVASSIDWYSEATQAASRTTVQPTTRDFDVPKREPAPREKKEFAWDETHTERVHALAGGGIGVHLSNNCELVLTPFPLAGCAFGKRQARGDLFEEMKAPVEPGDWK